MKTKKTNTELMWKELEDVLVPRLPLPPIDRAVYSHLLRHSRLEGRRSYRFSIRGLARHVQVSDSGARDAVRRLAEAGALRFVERSKAGHVVEVRVPEEIRLPRADEIEASDPKVLPGGINIEEADFLEDRMLREAIHEREGGLCFYCLRQLTPALKCLDHVVPRAALGRNTHRNLVSCCLECNSQKGERQAEDFLRGLYRERRLTAAELNGRLRALDALAAGKLRPFIAATAAPVARKGRPPLQPQAL